MLGDAVSSWPIAKQRAAQLFGQPFVVVMKAPPATSNEFGYVPGPASAWARTGHGGGHDHLQQRPMAGCKVPVDKALSLPARDDHEIRHDNGLESLVLPVRSMAAKPGAMSVGPPERLYQYLGERRRAESCI